MNDSTGQNPGSRPQRRVRYPGSHPRHFQQRYKEHNSEKYPELQEHVRAQGRTPAGTHVPVLVTEVLAALRPAKGEVVADLTVGFGGHTLALLERTAPDGLLLGLDLDGPQLESTRRRLETMVVPTRVSLHHSHFAGLPKVLATVGLDGVDIILADLGLSSMQIDDPVRGFSYKLDGPLDMRMDVRRAHSAADVLRSISCEDLAKALRELADETDHRAIAEAIVRRRSIHAFERTTELSDVVLKVKGLTRREWQKAAAAGKAGLHPAARTFQALRILVNEELQGVEQLLRIAPYCLRPGGRVGIISFHSGEDRRVEESFRAGLCSGVYSQVSEEPIRPTPAERHANPRSSSAKLRWAVR